jgi:hypothetical protein
LMPRRPAWLILAAGLAGLAACSQQSPESPPTGTEAASPSQAPSPLPSSSPVASEAPLAPGTIPAAMQGRWGLVPADCTSTRGDAKGLIVVSARDIRFYESLAKIIKASAATPSSLRAEFALSGEGETWSREMALEIADDGKALVRRDFGPEAAPEPLRYGKCS